MPLTNGTINEMLRNTLDISQGSVATHMRCGGIFSDSITKDNSAFHPSGVGKWVPASAGKAKAGMVHFVSEWMRGMQVKLWDPLRTRAIPERLRGVFTARRYTNTRLPLPLPYRFSPDSDSEIILKIG